MSAMCLADVSTEPPDLRELVPEVPEPRADLVARCLAMSPRARPTARELPDALYALADRLGAPPATELASDDGRPTIAA